MTPARTSPLPWNSKILVRQLIIAYADPHRFFKEVAPEDTPEDFDTTRLASPLHLGRTLWRWGFGALMNDDVRRAFDSATPNQLIEIIGLAEGREKYREGNPPGSGKATREEEFCGTYKKGGAKAR